MVRFEPRLLIMHRGLDTTFLLRVVCRSQASSRLHSMDPAKFPRQSEPLREIPDSLVVAADLLQGTAERMSELHTLNGEREMPFQNNLKGHPSAHRLSHLYRSFSLTSSSPKNLTHPNTYSFSELNHLYHHGLSDRPRDRGALRAARKP